VPPERKKFDAGGGKTHPKKIEDSYPHRGNRTYPKKRGARSYDWISRKGVAHPEAHLKKTKIPSFKTAIGSTDFRQKERKKKKVNTSPTAINRETFQRSGIERNPSMQSKKSRGRKDEAKLTQQSNLQKRGKETGRGCLKVSGGKKGRGGGMGKPNPGFLDRA